MKFNHTNVYAECDFVPNLVPIARRESACGQRIQARSYFPKRGTRDIMKKRLKEGQGGGRGSRVGLGGRMLGLGAVLEFLKTRYKIIHDAPKIFRVNIWHGINEVIVVLTKMSGCLVRYIPIRTHSFGKMILMTDNQIFSYTHSHLQFFFMIVFFFVGKKFLYYTRFFSLFVFWIPLNLNFPYLNLYYIKFFFVLLFLIFPMFFNEK